MDQNPNPETDPYRYTELFFLTNEQNRLNGGEIIFSINGARPVEYP